MRAWLLVVGLVVACKAANKPPTAPPRDPVTAPACATDDDCIVSCATKGDCCPNPYCETVQVRSAVLQATTYNDAHPCTKEDFDRCPQIGSRVAPTYGIAPRCQSGACVGEKTPLGAAAPVRVVDLRGYDLSCKADIDCAVVNPDVCSVCACATSPIAARDSQRFKAEAQAIACGEPEQGIQCGDCPAAKPACRAGACIARD